MDYKNDFTHFLIHYLEVLFCLLLIPPQLLFQRFPLQQSLFLGRQAVHKGYFAFVGLVHIQLEVGNLGLLQFTVVRLVFLVFIVVGEFAGKTARLHTAIRYF
jgi:hypothetical protein